MYSDLGFPIPIPAQSSPTFPSTQLHASFLYPFRNKTEKIHKEEYC